MYLDFDVWAYRTAVPHTDVPAKRCLLVPEVKFHPEGLIIVRTTLDATPGAWDSRDGPLLYVKALEYNFPFWRRMVDLDFKLTEGQGANVVYRIHLTSEMETEMEVIPGKPL